MTPRRLLCTSLALGLTACASGPPPDADIAAADVAVSEASDADAAARAPAPLALARDKLERARQAQADGNNYQASRLAEEALVDAELAAAAARSEVAREHAEELRSSIQTLRDELERRGSSTS